MIALVIRKTKFSRTTVNLYGPGTLPGTVALAAKVFRQAGYLVQAHALPDSVK